MSWNTSKGVRVLKGPEKELFLCGASYLRMLLEEIIGVSEPDEEDSTVYGCSQVFNEMCCEEKLVALAHVVKNLVNETPTEDLYAWSEATVHAVFVCVRSMLHEEIDTYAHLDDPDDIALKWKGKSIRYWLDKCGKKYKCYYEKPTSLNDTNIKIWEFVIEGMEERILWDEDFHITAVHLNCKQENKQVLNYVSGIDPDYFVMVPPGASKNRLEKAVEFLNSLDCLN